MDFLRDAAALAALRDSDGLTIHGPARSMRTPIGFKQNPGVFNLAGQCHAFACQFQQLPTLLGQIKDARGFRRFSFRGLFNVAREWDLMYAGRTTS
jgi:hypothetical protein